MFQSDLKLIVFQHGFFGERFVANLMNYPNSCPSYGACGIDGCTQCKEGLYNFSKNIIAVFSMPDPTTMPDFIENAEDFLPKVIPEADIAVAINLHPDVLAVMPEKLKGKVKALIVPVEEPRWCSPGLAKQIREKCDELGLEFAAPKPFCNLRPSEEHPTINRMIEEMRIGYPEFEIELLEDGKAYVRISRSQPCGCAYYIGVKLRGFDFSEVKEGKMRELWNVVAEAHHSYPCTASMERDNEYNETLLHVGGYIARHAVNRALGYEGDEDIPEHIKHIVL
ncbi:MULTISPECIES: DUF166 domain-containing protein [Archaeoglobus]|uniref:Thymidylate synthase n=3 Tax=Archaeoglobus fulgidus TaxID=2234 RepID=O28172_ARCFU|nr:MULTISPECIES: DUF166 domain-containing protein [Archaeoglobus]AAB89140.1 conserved hypothetical protein [Archaeoglobus fulgidus DSM 4304]AIG99093.1 hypothetical protein AFULGI_00023760 [Archaeoglobus fulgidus DSM 8774]KUJ94152.1 MAG: hypothetical protein XD40_0637 [Archaeoglobus fulgidus]KUK06859.1 MAG: hypothetical protein XD48_0913 [Archaeoglobus fulgidus]MDI3498145.1 thymidylate synthase [Archaeoglobus sp.]